MLKKNEKCFVISFLTMRKAIGYLAFLLPFVLILGSIGGKYGTLQGSLSSYYYTNMRDVFVGVLLAIALFLLSYKGYDKRDNRVTNIAGLLAIGIAIFPTASDSPEYEYVGVFNLHSTSSNSIHLTMAALFFLILAFISLFLFTKSDQDIQSKQKKRRNTIYKVCGHIIIFSIIALGASFNMSSPYLILIFETISLCAFGFSWLVKGEALFTDKISHTKKVVMKHRIHS